VPPGPTPPGPGPAPDPHVHHLLYSILGSTVGLTVLVIIILLLLWKKKNQPGNNFKYFQQGPIFRTFFSTKNNFQKPRKIKFCPTFFGKNFSRNFSRKFYWK
jgi:hypothetical protein